MIPFSHRSAAWLRALAPRPLLQHHSNTEKSFVGNTNRQPYGSEFTLSYLKPMFGLTVHTPYRRSAFVALCENRGLMRKENDRVDILVSLPRGIMYGLLPLGRSDLGPDDVRMKQCQQTRTLA